MPQPKLHVIGLVRAIFVLAAQADFFVPAISEDLCEIPKQ
jgi:hypothetical protein